MHGIDSAAASRPATRHYDTRLDSRTHHPRGLAWQTHCFRASGVRGPTPHRTAQRGAVPKPFQPPQVLVRAPSVRTTTAIKTHDHETRHASGDTSYVPLYASTYLGAYYYQPRAQGNPSPARCRPAFAIPTHPQS
jgi:hypothetical protein